MRVRAALRPGLTGILALTLAMEGGFSGRDVAQGQPMGGSPVDPPARVGRVARLLGTVSFRGAEQTEWQKAATNYPVTSGNLFWTEPSSAAEIGVGGTQIALDQSTELDIDSLDDHVLQATQPQGAVFLRVRQLPDGDLYRITTPRGAVVITRPGAYEIVAGDADHPTLVTVVEGGARIDSTAASLTLASGQTGRVEGTSNFAVSVGPAVMGRFLTARLDAEREGARNRAAIKVAPPQAVAQMSGGEALASTGTWATSASYGQIWYPPVQSSWVPYRDGHWGYVAPWGWTWIDDAPWGFAPFHYGRWVQDGPRWGWIPRERGVSVTVDVAPVYAPALVSFISVGVAVGVALSQGDRRDPRGSVGWVPLGPRETYVPPYRTSDRYVRDVNVSNVTNVTTINTVNNVNNVTNVTNLVNRNAATVVPVAAMTASQPVAAQRENLTPQALASAQAQRAAPVQPTTATLGVTPVVAKDLKLAPPATPPQTVALAPGPVVPPAAAAPVVVQSQPAAPVVVAPRPGAVDPKPSAKPGSAPAAVPPVGAAPAAAAPVAVTLPVLRPSTPAAPAHPDAGRAPGATGPAPFVPGATPAPTPVIVAPGAPIVPGSPAAKPIVPPLVTPTPQAAKPGTPAPGVAVPSAPVPPVVVAPQAAKPGTPAPGVAAPAVPVPPAVVAPQAAKPGTPAPGVAAPAVPAPPAVVAPQAAKPGTPAPGVAAPAVPAPPVVVAPQATKPGAPAPGVAAPAVPAPSVVVAPPAAKPGAPAPAPIQPVTPMPAPVPSAQAPSAATTAPATKPGGPPADTRPNQRGNSTPDAAKPVVPVPPVTISPQPNVVPVPPVAAPRPPLVQVPSPALPGAVPPVPPKVPPADGGKDSDTKPKP